MPRRTKEDAARTREQILEAALKVFSEKGYSKATFVDIADEIGLSKGAVYWHFKTKLDLLAAMIAYSEEKMCSSVGGKLPDSVKELRDRIETYATMYTTDDHAWNFEFFCSFQIEWSTELMSEVHLKLVELRGDPLKDLEEKLLHLQQIGALSKKQDARMLALCAASAWVGSMHMAMYGECDRQQFVDVLMNSFDLIVSNQAIEQM